MAGRYTQVTTSRASPTWMESWSELAAHPFDFPAMESYRSEYHLSESFQILWRCERPMAHDNAQHPEPDPVQAQGRTIHLIGCVFSCRFVRNGSRSTASGTPQCGP